MNPAAIFSTCSRPTLPQARRLLDAGIPARMIARRDLVRVSRVAAVGRLFDFVEDGTPSWITPVCGLPDGTLEYPQPLEVIDQLPVLDLVAWRLTRPMDWALLRGAVTVAGLIEPQNFGPPPVVVHRSVLDWLAADTDGVVLLTDKPRERGDILREFAEVAAADAKHRAELIADASRPWPIPRITVRRDVRRAVA